MAITDQRFQPEPRPQGATDAAPLGIGNIIVQEKATLAQDDRSATHSTESQKPRVPQLFASQQQRRLIASLLLSLLTFVFYSPATRAPFLNYDDGVYIAENAHVRAGLTWSTVTWAFHSTEQWSWQPVTWLSHAFDCQIFGLNPAGPHAVNIFFHVANVVLLFLILAAATGFFWRSLAVAALFALHPINVESVAWIAERKNVLSMFFFLLALAAYGCYSRRPGVTRYLTVTAAYALALMSKPQVITFPFALLLLDYWPLRRFGDVSETQDPASVSSGVAVETGKSPSSSLWRLFLEKLPWFAMSAISAVITKYVQATATQADIPLTVRLENAALSYAKYLGKVFWPVDLAPIYPHPMHSIKSGAAIAAAVALIAMSIVAVIFRRNRPLFVGWFWFLGTLVPMLGLVQISVQAMADRFAYIPLLGILVIVCWTAAGLVESCHISHKTTAVATSVVLLSLGFALHRQVGFWQNNVSLWSRTLEITENNYTAEDNLATALLAEGRIPEAMPHFRQALLYRPDDVMATLNLAVWDQMRANYQAAAEGYTNVLAYTKVPGFITLAHINRGYARVSLKQYPAAKQDFEEGLRGQPENWAAHRGLGLVAQKTGDIITAVKYYRREVELQPSAVAYLLLAQALDLAGQKAAASQAEAKAMTISRDPSDDRAAVKMLIKD